MKTTMSIYRETILRRLKRTESKLETLRKSMEIESTPTEKRLFIELKARINELETVLYMADTLCEMEDGKNGTIQQKDS